MVLFDSEAAVQAWVPFSLNYFWFKKESVTLEVCGLEWALQAWAVSAVLLRPGAGGLQRHLFKGRAVRKRIFIYKPLCDPEVRNTSKARHSPSCTGNMWDSCSDQFHDKESKESMQRFMVVINVYYSYILEECCKMERIFCSSESGISDGKDARRKCRIQVPGIFSLNILYFWFFLSTFITEDDLCKLPPKCPVIDLQRGAMVRKVGPWKLLHFCGYLSKKSSRALLRTGACQSDIALISLGNCSTALTGCASQRACIAVILFRIVLWPK